MKPKMEFDTASLAVIGVDIGKEVIQLDGLGVVGKIAFRKKIRRLGLKDAFEKLPPCIVGMEACLSAHFVSRALRALGHQPRIIPAIYVKPFVKGQKNDYNDAEAIAEAALRPNLRFVQEKSQDQLDLQACHRVRSRLVSRRTATINQIRAFLIEQGIAVRSGLRTLRKSLFAILENRKDEISPRTATLILGRISKRGSKYLRTLLIQAAKVLLMRPHNWPRYSFGAWLKTASERLHRNKLAVALANKLGRIAWSVLRHDKAFDTHLEAVAISAAVSPSSRLRKCMERIDRRTLNLVPLMAA